MMKIASKKDGYILILTLMILSILVALVTTMFYNGTAHNVLTKTVIDRERAKMLALSGVQFAISRLTVVPQTTQVDSQPKAVSGGKHMQQENKKVKTDIAFLTRILPNINRWDVINLKEDIDGIDGQIKIAISCENGKININKIFDFGSHKFIGEGGLQDIKKFLQELNKRIKPLIGDKDFLKGLQQFLQKRKFPLNDVTELLEIPEFAYFKNFIFYEPPLKKEEKRPVYLMDLFTIWTDNFRLQPWLFSDSVNAVLGLKRADVEGLKISEQLIKNFKPMAMWFIDWNKILQPIYGKDFVSLPKGIDLMLDSGFDPNVFSVVSYGTVGEITQKIFAILQMQKSGDEAIFELKKLYWI